MPPRKVYEAECFLVKGSLKALAWKAQQALRRAVILNISGRKSEEGGGDVWTRTGWSNLLTASKGWSPPMRRRRCLDVSVEAEERYKGGELGCMASVVVS